MTALPSGMTEIFNTSFDNPTDGAALDILFQPTFYNPSVYYFGIQVCVVIDGDTSAIQWNGYLTQMPGYDTRMLMTEVNPISSGSHTVSVYAASFGAASGTTLNCEGCLVKGILRMN